MAYLKMEEVLKLLETQPPGTPMELSCLCAWLNGLVKRRARDWVRENRQLILDEWRFVLDFNL